MDQKDMFAFFLELKSKYSDAEIVHIFENHDISKLHIHRMYRYLDKYTKEDDVVEGDDCCIEDEHDDDVV
jgi:hypothetical protein